MVFFGSVGNGDVPNNQCCNFPTGKFHSSRSGSASLEQSSAETRCFIATPSSGDGASAWLSLGFPLNHQKVAPSQTHVYLRKREAAARFREGSFSLKALKSTPLSNCEDRRPQLEVANRVHCQRVLAASGRMAHERV